MRRITAEDAGLRGEVIYVEAVWLDSWPSDPKTSKTKDHLPPFANSASSAVLSIHSAYLPLDTLGGGAGDPYPVLLLEPRPWTLISMLAAGFLF